MRALSLAAITASSKEREEPNCALRMINKRERAIFGMKTTLRNQFEAGVESRGGESIIPILAASQLRKEQKEMSTGCKTVVERAPPMQAVKGSPRRRS